MAIVRVGTWKEIEEKKTEIGLELEVIRKKEKQKKNGRRRRMEEEEGKRSRGCCVLEKLLCPQWIQ